MKNSILKEKIDDYKIHRTAIVSFKEMGNVSEICYKGSRNNTITIKLLDKDHYIDLTTGEVKECNHITDRSQNKFQVGQSLKRLRDLINTNCTNYKEWKWITLTYRENMRDPKRLKEDFKRFIRKSRKAFKEYKIDYIGAMEPQARGAWHCHLMLWFHDTAPTINNKIITKLWEQGNTWTQNIDENIDNIGAYLTAYIGDLDAEEIDPKTMKTIEANLKKQGKTLKDFDIKEITEIQGQKLGIPKRFIKGARLYLYPPKFNIYRASKGIKSPEKQYLYYYEAIKKVGNTEPTYKTTFRISSYNESKSYCNFSDVISYEYYNIKRAKTQTEVDINPLDRKEYTLNYSKELNSIRSMIPTQDKPSNIIIQEIDGTCELHGKNFENWQECQNYLEDRGIKKYLKFDVVEPFYIKENR